MKIIKLICPNCKANLVLDEYKKEFQCKFCRTPILLDDEIIKVEHNVSDKIREEDLKKARTYLYDFEDYDKAYKIYEELSEKYPYEPEVWLGLVISITDNFTRYTYLSDEIIDTEEIDNYINKYIRIEKNENRKKEYIKKYQKYKEMKKETQKEFKQTLIQNTFIAIVSFIIILMILILLTASP